MATNESNHTLRNRIVEAVIGDGILAVVIYLLIEQISSKLDLILSLLQTA